MLLEICRHTYTLKSSKLKSNAKQSSSVIKLFNSQKTELVVNGYWIDGCSDEAQRWAMSKTLSTSFLNSLHIVNSLSTITGKEPRCKMGHFPWSLLVLLLIFEIRGKALEILSTANSAYVLFIIWTAGEETLQYIIQLNYNWKWQKKQFLFHIHVVILYKEM